MKNLIKIASVIFLVFSLAACEKGEVSKYSEADKSSQQQVVVDGLNGSGDGGDNSGVSAPLTPEQLAQLPQVDAGSQQFADANVVVMLSASATVLESAEIARVLWTQKEGPEVETLSPNGLSNLFVAPDVSEETRYVFQVAVQDTNGRVNADSLSVIVRPVGSFLRVLGGVVNETDGVAVFKVVLNAASSESITVNYMTQSETALEGEDFLALSGELVFAPGEVEKSVSVTLLTDANEEEFETFSLQITAVTEDSTVQNTGAAVIRNVNAVTSPTPMPTVTPTPTANPTATPTPTPTVAPTAIPTVMPSVTPEPTVTPTQVPDPNTGPEWDEKVSAYFRPTIIDQKDVPSVSRTSSIVEFVVDDFDGDSDVDIVLRSDVLLNDGSQVFSSFIPGIFSSEVPPPLNRLFVDIEGDNDLDIAASNTEGFSIWENLGEDNYAERPVSEVCNQTFIDFDGDGDIDTACLEETEGGVNFKWLENTGNFVFTSHAIPLVNCSGGSFLDNQASLFHLNGDNFLDLYVRCSSEGNSFFTGDSNSSFSGGLSLSIEEFNNSGNYTDFADVDKDGDIDLLFIGEQYTAGWAINDGSNNFALTLVASSLSEFQENGEAVDVDEDGDLDILVSGTYGRAHWLENIGASSYLVHSLIGLDFSSVTTFLKSVDLNGDGLRDIVGALILDVSESGGYQEIIWYERMDYDAVDYLVAEGETLVGAQTATDPDGDTIRYSVFDDLNAGAFSIDANTGELSLTQPAVFQDAEDPQANFLSVIVMATDGEFVIRRLIQVEIVRLPQTKPEQ